MARSVRSNQRLEVGSDVAAVLRPEEVARLHDRRDLEHVICAVCGRSIGPGSTVPTSVSISLNGDRVTADFAHAECSPSRADLARLAVLAEAEPLGIHYAQALHSDAGAVMLWERRIDVRMPALDGTEEYLYLDRDWWEGFHSALADEPVRLLAGWRLEPEGADLVLNHREQAVERFHGAIELAPLGWLESLQESGFCLLIVGAGIGLDRPAAPAIQRAIREHRALMGLAEFEV